MTISNHELATMRAAVRFASPAVGRDYEHYCTPPTGLRDKNPGAWAWADTWQRGSLFAHGPEGTGKSSMARYLICRGLGMKVCPRDFEYEYLPLAAYDLYAPDLQLAASDGSFDGQRNLRHMVDRARYSSLLLIDDIDRAHWDGRGLDALRSIVNYRHEHRYTIFVTSNRNPKDLGAWMTERHDGDKVGAMSLLRRMRPMKLWTFTGDSYRLQLTETETATERTAT